MHRYAVTRMCREVFLRSYFGETDAEPCGKCDNCTQSNRKEIAHFDKSDITVIKNILGDGLKSAAEIKKKTGWKSAKCKRVVGYMLRENIIETAEDGSFKIID